MHKDEVPILKEAHKKGKQIQVLESGTTDTWIDWDVMKRGLCADSTYRVKPEQQEKIRN